MKYCSNLEVKLGLIYPECHGPTPNLRIFTISYIGKEKKCQ